MSSILSINSKFTLPSKNQQDEAESIIIHKTFDESNCEISRLGLAPGSTPLKVR